MIRESAGRVYEFGPFRYDAGQRLLFREGALVPLVPKAVDTLHVLLDAHGRIVDKADLIRLVWPDTTVEEVGLARNISLLRKALEDDSGETYIETIPKRGYRFLAEVREIGAPESPPQPRHYPNWKRHVAAFAVVVAMGGAIYWQFYSPSRFLKHRPGDAALAVVPFLCATGDRECVAFSDGLDEQLVADLSKLDWVQVLSPSTVKRHQKLGNSMGLMGRLLGLDVLVEGSVQKLADGFRITANLVDVHTGRLIWAENYDCPGPDLERNQAQTARRISASVGAHLAIDQRFRTREGFIQENRTQSERSNPPDPAHAGSASDLAERNK
jgi:DNA-binding winged helix-turn-helix (wHTH) protein/TolB-like protein